MADFIAYYRVSTSTQAQSGLGLEAQKKAVLDFINGNRDARFNYRRRANPSAGPRFRGPICPTYLVIQGSGLGAALKEIRAFFQ
jgi:hypothetical protein